MFVRVGCKARGVKNERGRREPTSASVRGLDIGSTLAMHVPGQRNLYVISPPTIFFLADSPMIAVMVSTGSISLHYLASKETEILANNTLWGDYLEKVREGHMPI